MILKLFVKASLICLEFIGFFDYALQEFWIGGHNLELIY